MWKWHILVHVCRRWRYVVFASPSYLNLRLLCTSRTSVGNLSIWPAFPIIVDFHYHFHHHSHSHRRHVDNVITALEHRDRVCDIRLSITSAELEKIATATQEPFPVLTSLRIVPSKSKEGSELVLPAEFLGGSAPRLQHICLHSISFPALPTLLLSTDLVSLELRDIPPIGYFSPEALVVGLAASPRLKVFIFGFQFDTSRPRRICLPPETRTVLPTLTTFRFRGGSEYLEDFVARIDSPQLKGIGIYYLNQLADFQAAQLAKFIDRSVSPKSVLFRHVSVAFFPEQVTLDAVRHPSHPSEPKLQSATSVLCEGIDWQVSHMAQVLSQFSATLSNVVHLNLNTSPKEYRQPEDTDVEWVHLLHQFSTAQTLHVSRGIAGPVALALESIVGQMLIAEVLPSLELIYMEGQPASTVGKFVAARQLADLPVTVVDTEEEFDEKIKSYASE